MSSLKPLNIEITTEATDWNLGRGFQTVETCDGIKSVIGIPLFSTCVKVQYLLLRMYIFYVVVVFLLGQYFWRDGR
jgi:hypothetical protein